MFIRILRIQTEKACFWSLFSTFKDLKKIFFRMLWRYSDTNSEKCHENGSNFVLVLKSELSVGTNSVRISVFGDVREVPSSVLEIEIEVRKVRSLGYVRFGRTLLTFNFGSLHAVL